MADVDLDLAAGTTEVVASSPTDGAGPWSSRTTRVAGVVLAVWVIFRMVEMAMVKIDLGGFDRLRELQGNVVARVAICGVLLALLFHALDGMRIVLLEVAPGLARRDRVLAGGVAFLTLALALPGWAIVLRPWIETTFR